MTHIDELFESMQTAMHERPVPAFEDVLRRRRRTFRRRLSAGSASLVVAGVAGAGAYLAIPGPATSPDTARLSAAASSGAATSRPAPELASGVCSNVRITRPSDSGGQSDPITAAQDFARHSDDGYPTAGWRVTYQATNVAQVESGPFDAFVVRGEDGTWQVLSAQRCD